MVYRWASEGYVEILAAERGEVVHPEPFEVTPIEVAVLFGDDERDADEDDPARP